MMAVLNEPQCESPFRAHHRCYTWGYAGLLQHDTRGFVSLHDHARRKENTEFTDE